MKRSLGQVKGFLAWFKKDLKRLNRSLLTRVLKGSVRPYTKLKQRLREGIQLCEVFDKERGVFIIYLTRSPDKEGFYDELGHEAFHLLNARDKCWLIEGVASLLSYDYAISRGKSWQTWSKLFEQNPDGLYAKSFDLAHKLKQLGTDFYETSQVQIGV